MARKCLMQRDLKRRKLAKSTEAKRAKLLEVARNRDGNPEEILQANMELAKLPRNSNPTRIKNRCLLTGRPRSFYRKFKISRIKLRELANEGKLPGVKKSSW